MAFRTVRNGYLALWQSAVAFVRERQRRGEPATQDQDEFERATADYAEASYESMPTRWRLPSLESVLQRLTRARLDQGASNGLAVQSAVAHHLSIAQARGDGANALRIVRRFRPFEEGQPVWAACIAEHQAYLSRASQVVYRSPVFGGDLLADFSVIDGVLGENARVGLVSDWGTGEPEARRVMHALTAKSPDVIIHLGDIYFSGTPHECARRFRSLIRTDVGFKGPVYTLAGNHDYFSGGEGFYQLIDALNPAAHRQPASYFNLRNQYWQLLAADTGHNDAAPWLFMSTLRTPQIHKQPIRDDEVRWHKHQLGNAEGRRTIVLSHHQFGSLAAKIGKPAGGFSSNPALEALFGPYFEGTVGVPGVAAWFWGHEHELVELERYYKRLPLGACIGHGAIPVRTKYRPRVSYKGEASPRELRDLGTDGDGYLNRGFALLHLQGKGAQIEHVDVDASGSSTTLGYQKL